MNNEEIDKIFDEIYRRMFKEAEPSGDFDEILKSGEGKFPNFFMAYYLSDDKQEEIIIKVLDKFKVRDFRREGIKNGIFLGSAPSGNKEATKKQRLDYDKRLKIFLDIKAGGFE